MRIVCTDIISHLLTISTSHNNMSQTSLFPTHNGDHRPQMNRVLREILQGVHREKMNRVLRSIKMNSVLRDISQCLSCGKDNIHNRERIYLDYDKDDRIGICCNIECQLELSLFIKYFYRSHPGYVPAARV
jgi:hypothetical protein